MGIQKEHRKELTSAQHNERLQSELDGLHDSRKISDATFPELKGKHLRTPYGGDCWRGNSASKQHVCGMDKFLRELSDEDPIRS